MGLVSLADGDDLTVAGLEPEPELAGLVLVDLELARHVVPLSVEVPVSVTAQRLITVPARRSSGTRQEKQFIEEAVLALPVLPMKSNSQLRALGGTLAQAEPTNARQGEHHRHQPSLTLQKPNRSSQ